jgi:protein-disulfide isomerase
VARSSKADRNVLAAAEHKRDVIVRIVLTAIVVVFALVVGIVVIAGRESGGGTGASPSSVTESGAVRAAVADVELAEGTTNPKRVVTIYEDFQCPVCKNFESTFGDALDALRTSGAAAIDYHPIAILDRMSSTDYSTRAANASACVADSSTETWLDFHSAAYTQQPAEGGQGLSDDQLSAIAVQAGASESVGDCISGGRYTDWVASTTQSVLDSGVNATPTVLLNGETLDLTTPADLSAAVLAIQ